MLDIVLSAEPDNSVAAEVGIEVHEILLSRTGNFWLSSWLKNQIKLLKGAEAKALSF